MKKLMSIVAGIFLITSCASNNVKSGEKNIKETVVNYNSGSTKLKGYLVKDQNSNEKRPGVLIVHEWWGNNDYARMRAKMVAELGYTVMALDMYGEGKTVETPNEAGELAKKTMSNPEEAKKRFEAALEQLKNDPSVDQSKIYAVGYCFGGGVILNMLNMGVDLQAGVSFHGALGSVKTLPKNLNTKLLILNGEADPMVTKADIANFKSITAKNKISMKFVNYPGALHAFTNQKATEIGKKYKLPIAYDSKADKNSWQEMKIFFEKI